VRVFIALGSNVEDRQARVCAAIVELETLGRVHRVSSFYDTEPVGLDTTEWFVNAVVELDTRLPPRGLLQGLQEIERRAGRDRSLPAKPRTLDLDLLLYENEVIVTDELIVPHPGLSRRFVLEPLAEIAPLARHPLLWRTMRELLAASRDRHQVRKLP
jgi:2-amino-4-hydroxy-6-hydroxymethyldihydropteridine diphosphokinase